MDLDYTAMARGSNTIGWIETSRDWVSEPIHGGERYGEYLVSLTSSPYS